MPHLRQMASPVSPGMCTVTHAHPPAHRQLFFQRRAKRADRHKDRLMFVELRLRLPAVQRWRNTHQFENGFGQHAGWIFANPVNHHRKTEFVQQNRQQRRQVGLFTRAVVTGDDNRHRLACRRRQLDGVILHGFVKSRISASPSPLIRSAINTPPNSRSGTSPLSIWAYRPRAVSRSKSRVVFPAPDLFNDFAIVHLRLLT